MSGRLVALLSTLAVFACSTVGVRDTEEPHYTVTGMVGAVEIRQYGPRIAADTVVQGDELAARSTGFRRIAAYIFGQNSTGAKIAMTAPVAQSAAAEGPGSGVIAMSADATQHGGPAEAWRIRFFMPAGLSLAALPAPNDPLVKLTPLPPETVAVVRFSGTPTPAAVATRTSELIAGLEHSAWRPSGAPVAWFYDPPWTVPVLRRNEVAVPVSPN